MLKHGSTPVTEVVVHTSATKGNWHKGKTVEQMADEIRGWHKAKRWKDIGYHAVIAPDGSIAYGRAISTTGAHVSGHNTGSLGVCLIPVKTIEKIGVFGDFYTPKQKAALLGLLRGWSTKIDLRKISGHNEYANKLCPGFRVADVAWLQLPLEKARPTPWFVTILNAILGLFGRRQNT